jgi:hypothetical protein
MEGRATHEIFKMMARVSLEDMMSSVIIRSIVTMMVREKFQLPIKDRNRNPYIYSIYL